MKLRNSKGKTCTNPDVLRLAHGPKCLSGSERVVCRSASRAATKLGAAKASFEHLHGLATPPSPSTTHYAKRAHKQGWSSVADAAIGGLQWQQTVKGATDALTADMARHAWSLSIREVTRLATTTSKLAKASKVVRKASGAGGAGSPIAAVQQLFDALVVYAQHAPVLEAADPSAWCVLLHGLVSASQVLPGVSGSARAKLHPLLMRAAACMPGPQDWLAWSPSHNPSLRPQTLSSLMWAFAVLGYKLHGSSSTSAGLRESTTGVASSAEASGNTESGVSVMGAPQDSVANATASSRGSVKSSHKSTRGSQARMPVNATAAGAAAAAGAAGLSSKSRVAPHLLLLHLVRSLLQSMRYGAMRTAQARHWAVLLWSLAKVGAPATEVEHVLENVEADVAVCGPMAMGLCNAQDISNTLWAVAEGGFTSMHAPALNSAAQGLQLNNVLLAAPTSAAPANSTQSLQAAANTAWAVQQILSNSSSSRRHKPRQQLDAGVQEAALQVAACCASALKGPLLSHYTLVASREGSEEAGWGPASLKKGWSSSACMGVCALANVGYYEEELWSLAVWVILQEAAQQQRQDELGLAQREAREQQQEQQQQQQEQGGQDRGLSTNVSSVLWACARVGHGLHSQQHSLHTQHSLSPDGLSSSLTDPHAHPLQGRMNCDVLALMLLAGSQHSVLGVPAPRPPTRSSINSSSKDSSSNKDSSSSKNSSTINGWRKGRVMLESEEGMLVGSGLDQAASGDEQANSGRKEASSGDAPVSSGHEQASSSHEQAGSGDGQPSSGEGQPSSGEGQPSSGEVQPSCSHEQASGSHEPASSGDGQAGGMYTQASARSVSMALFALAVLWPVLLAEEHRQESSESTEMLSHANSRSGSSTTDIAYNACSIELAHAAGRCSTLQQTALALFGAAAAHQPAHFSQPGLTQLQMAFMEVTESGLLSLEQLQAVGWLQPAARLGTPPTHTPASHSPTSHSLFGGPLEHQLQAPPLPLTEAQHGGQPNEAMMNGQAWDTPGALAPSIAAADMVETGGQSLVTHAVLHCGCSVARAAAAAWQASQGSDVELEYASPLSSMVMPGNKGTISSTTTSSINNNSSNDNSNNVGYSNASPLSSMVVPGDEDTGTCSDASEAGNASSAGNGESQGSADGDASLGAKERAEERLWRLQVSRSQQEVVEVLSGMGCQGLQVEGPTPNQSMRVDIMLPSVDPTIFASYLPALSSSGACQPQEGPDVSSSPQSFGPVAIEFNGPNHYLAIPACTPTGSTLLRRRQLQRHTQRVVSIPWWEWAALQSSGRGKEHYLAELIMDGHPWNED